MSRLFFFMEQRHGGRTTVTTTKRIQTFVNGCLRRIVGGWWPEIISNERLWRRTSDAGRTRDPTETMEMDWSHLCKPVDSITRQALTWNPEGKRKRGRPRNTWRRDLEADAKETGYTCYNLERLAQNWSAWRSHVGGLCPRRGDEGFN